MALVQPSLTQFCCPSCWPGFDLIFLQNVNKYVFCFYFMITDNQRRKQWWWHVSGLKSGMLHFYSDSHKPFAKSFILERGVIFCNFYRPCLGNHSWVSSVVPTLIWECSLLTLVFFSVSSQFPIISRVTNIKPLDNTSSVFQSWTPNRTTEMKKWTAQTKNKGSETKAIHMLKSQQ